MLLPNMTFDEIRRLLFLEIEEVIQRTEKQFPKIKRDVLKRKLKNQKVVYFYRLTTKNKTKWLTRVAKHKGSKYKIISYYGSFFRDTKGFRYIELNKEDESLEIYNAHFLYRYVERMKLDLTEPLEIMKAFFLANTGVSVINYDQEIDEEVYKIYSQTPEGIKLGIHDRIRNVVIWNTFISANEYKGEQKLLIEKMGEFIRREKTEEPNKKRMSDELEYMDKIMGILNSSDQQVAMH